MGNNNNRPVYLNLFKIRLPVTGVVSIVHRVSGVLLVTLLPPLLYFFDASLKDPDCYNQLLVFFRSPGGRFAVLFTVWLLAQHFFSGIRHLLLDVDIGVGRASARRNAWLTFAAAFVFTAVVGVAL